jgi:acetyl esterase/lipase
MNVLGYDLLGKKQLGEAIKIFRLNTEAYPTSSNAYDSLAEAYIAAGDKRVAAHFYRQALTIAPDSERQVLILKDLGAPVTQNEWIGMFKRVLPSTVRLQSDITYKRLSGRNLKLHFMTPATITKDRLPLIVFIHGGGWTDGTKERGIFPLTYFVQNGFAAASIEYRLTGEAIFPAQIQDVKDAIRFLRGNAQKFRIDPDRISVWGQSAGGHLAALVGTSAGAKELGDRDKSAAVQAVIDWNGPTDFLKDEAAMALTTQKDSAINRLVGGPLKDRRHMAALANPLSYIDRTDPPFLIMHGDADNVVDIKQSKLLFDALVASGVPAKFEILPGEQHFGVGELPLGHLSRLRHRDQAELGKTMLDFLRTTLKIGSINR